MFTDTHVRAHVNDRVFKIDDVAAEFEKEGVGIPKLEVEWQIDHRAEKRVKQETPQRGKKRLADGTARSPSASPSASRVGHAGVSEALHRRLSAKMGAK